MNELLEIMDQKNKYLWISLLSINENEFSALQSSLSVELALLPSPRGSPMSMPLPFEHYENEFSALQSSLSVELALLPSPRGSPMSMQLPSEHCR